MYQMPFFKALNMTSEQQAKDIQAMKERINRYDVYKWASEFMRALNNTREKQAEHLARKVSKHRTKVIEKDYRNSKARVLFLDYDGTLQRFFDNPGDAKPDQELIDLLNGLSAQEHTNLVIISGRDKDTLNEWFGDKGYTLIGEHGAWIKVKDDAWKSRNQSQSTWKDNIRPILESYVDRTPGSLIEEKTHSLVWHYRKADIELGALRALELTTDISNLIINQELEILEGSKVVEVKVSGINKGHAAIEYIQSTNFDFIMAIGDDWTDEYLFKDLPSGSLTIKVGTDRSAADYYVDNYKEVRALLKNLKE